MSIWYQTGLLKPQ